MIIAKEEQERLEQVSLISDEDKRLINEIKDVISMTLGEEGFHEKEYNMLHALDRIVGNLQAAPMYCHKLSSDENHYYHCECSNCGWSGSSRYLGGGGAIADTGDHGDVYCPVCLSIDV